MFDAVYEWVKNLAFYLVVMTAVLEVLPGNEFKKYIRFFTGLVLILLVITPVLKLTGSFGQFQEKYQGKERELQMEIERQKEVFEKAELFDFLPEAYLPEEKSTDHGTIKVEEIKVGEDKEKDMESDAFRE